MDILRNVPLGLYLESPRTWLHQRDPRVKFVWLLSVLLSPILATDLWRILIVGALLVLTFLIGLPRRVWSRQLGLVMLLSGLTFLLTFTAPDGLGVTPQVQRQDAQVSQYGLVSPPSPSLPPPSIPPSPYRYRLFADKVLGFGPLIVTQRSLSIANRLSTLIFTLLYATNLFLLTTSPEEVAESLERLGHPLKRWRIPVSEIILTLTLALRFLPLVLEEVQNLVRAVRTRDIRWQTLSLRTAIHTLLSLVERLLENLLLRAEQTANAMQVRGFMGSQHQVRWHRFRLNGWDGLMLLFLLAFWGVRLWRFSDF
ncbi:MAG: CbiQ family ECF transporter T component [Cyanobacteriota bacterium]|nr:CbiQ family ECF transporter T component [Cyanobacteriota bacterium]